MVKKKEIILETGDLRSRAEALLNEDRHQQAPSGNETGLQLLLQELHVNQIELEIQNEELRRSGAKVEAGLEQYTALYDFAPLGYFTLRQDGTIQQVNLSGASLLGVERNHLVGARFGLFVDDADLPLFNIFLKKVFVSQGKETIELTLREKEPPLSQVQSTFPQGGFAGITDQHRVWIEAVPARDRQTCLVALIDVSERKKAEEWRQAENDLLRICYSATTTAQLLHELILYFKRLTGCEAVGVRLHKGDDFPYYETHGFTEKFVKAESSLCARDSEGCVRRDNFGNPVLDCMCGNILCGRFDPSKSFFTDRGSFWSGNTTELLATTTDADRQARTRNRCNGEGYESVALIPLRSRGKTFGLFQFNDRRRGLYTLERIKLLEELVDHVSLALANLESVEALTESEERYRSFVENAHDTIYTMELDGLLTYVSPNWNVLLGHTPAEIIGHSFEEIVHPDDVPAYRILLEDLILKGKKNAEIEYRVRHKNGSWRWHASNVSPLSYAGGQVEAVIGIARDITEFKQVQEALANNEIRLRELIDNVDGWVWAVDRDYRLLVCNSRYQERNIQYHGVPLKIGENILDNPMVTDQMRKDWMGYLHRVLNGEQFVVTRSADMDVENRVDEITFRPVRNSENEIVGMAVMLRDITERSRVEEKLRESEELFRSLLQNVQTVAIQGYTPDGTVHYWNKGSELIYDYSAGEAIGQNLLELIIPGEMRSEVQQAIQSMAATGEIIPAAELSLQRKDGSRVSVYSSHALVQKNGRVPELFCIDIDLSERKKMEETLQASLVEKDVLLREIHHRVKNNLAAILGLLNLERQTTNDPNANVLLVELGSRIKSMATVHEKLYRSENLSKIDFHDYLITFITHLKTTYRPLGGVLIHVDARDVYLSLDIAVPCGLIVNELVTNSIKYAFPERKPGLAGDEVCEINVSMKAGESCYTLSVSDNGIGFPKDLDWRSARTMGLRLVKMLGEYQIGGTIELDNSRGTMFTLKFTTAVRD